MCAGLCVCAMATLCTRARKILAHILPYRFILRMLHSRLALRFSWATSPTIIVEVAITYEDLVTIDLYERGTRFVPCSK